MFEPAAAWGIRTKAGAITVLRTRICLAVGRADRSVDRRLSGSRSITYANEEESIHGGQQIGTCRSREGRRRGRQGQGQEAVGAVTGRDDVTREGRAQQDKAEAQRNAAKKEAEAEAARGSAKVAEERQRSHQ